MGQRTGAVLQVALCSLWAAVHVIRAAHGIGHRAAAVRAVGHLAARGLIRTSHRLVWTLNIVGCRGDLLQQRHSVVTRPADAMFQVALRVAWATVEMIAAAHGLWVWAAAVVSTCQQATGVTVRAAAFPARTCH